ncbi:MAG: drug efflux transport system permease protein ybhF [Candidatus Sumerlaeota bacterium]|nr:drug efflux transport system permease protein ybhF [Candidatus Sumerlaeota bacterium]
MLRGLLAIMYKEILQVRRDPATRFVFLIPVIQTIIFGFAIDMDVQHIPTVVFDQDRSMESRRVVERLENTGTFEIVGTALSSDEVYETIVVGRAKVGIIVPPDYSARLLDSEQATIQVLIDGSDSTVANNAMQTSRAIGQLQAMEMGGLDIDEMPVEVRPRVLFNPDLESAHFYVPGLIGIILQLVTVLLTAFSIVRERERGTLEQLVVTPVSKSALIIGKLVPYAVIGMAQTVFVLALMRFLFGVPISGDVGLLLALSGLFLLPSLALGILISTLSVNQAQAMQMALLVMLPSVLLSGFAFPRETMPLPIYGLSFCVPVTYYIQILRGLILRGAGLQALWPQTAALAGFAVLLVMLSMMRFKKRLA